MVCTRGQCASVLFRSPSAPAAFAHTRNAGVYIWRAELHAVVAVLPRCAEICRAVLWCAVQIPLIPLPLPNVTIYFTIWRIISNRSAGQGENTAQQPGKHSIGKSQQAAKHRSQQSAAAGHAQQSAKHGSNTRQQSPQHGRRQLSADNRQNTSASVAQQAAQGISQQSAAISTAQLLATPRIRSAQQSANNGSQQSTAVSKAQCSA